MNLPRNLIIEYKYLLFSNNSYAKVQNVRYFPEFVWEKLPESLNRVVFTHKKIQVLVEETFNDVNEIREETLCDQDEEELELSASLSQQQNYIDYMSFHTQPIPQRHLPF